MTVESIERVLLIDPNNKAGEQAVFQASANCKGNGDKRCGFFQTETKFPEKGEFTNLGNIANSFRSTILLHEANTSGKHNIKAKITYRIPQEE